MRPSLVISISTEEQSILDSISWVNYGELHDINAPMEGNDIKVELSGNEYNFIKNLRQMGRFDVVSIHDGFPVSAQKADLTPSGRKCIVKVKF